MTTTMARIPSLGLIISVAMVTVYAQAVTGASASTISQTNRDVSVMAIPRSTFKAAVYAHAVYIPIDPSVVSRAVAVRNMEVNLAVYRQQAGKARQQNASIIVFPEDGIYGMTFSRDTIYPYLEQIPDPATETWTPCTDPHRHNDSDVQVALSCIARQNQMYVVANMGDRQPCDPSHDPKCPKDRRYQFNTNVAYGPSGQFLAKYHKYNLFFEWQFDTPPTPFHVYFDTPFGRVGLATCFDVLFREPIVSLVEDFKVNLIAFPTAWMDALPLLPAIGFHSSFARAHGVNFLSANIHLPEFRFDGTGLYGPDGAHAFYYGAGSDKLAPKLLVADMDIVKPQHRRQPTRNTRYTGDFLNPYSLLENHGVDAKKSPSINENSTSFQSELFSDTYTFKLLTQSSGNLQVCQGKVCCYLEYQLAINGSVNRELFALGAFDGLHTKDGNYYMQNCVLVKCADRKNKTSCGSPTFTSTTRFSKIVLRGQFQTKYVYPQVIVSDSQGHLALTKPSDWSFSGSTVETSGSFNSAVLNAVLLGRDYTRDQPS